MSQPLPIGIQLKLLTGPTYVNRHPFALQVTAFHQFRGTPGWVALEKPTTVIPGQATGGNNDYRFNVERV